MSPGMEAGVEAGGCSVISTNMNYLSLWTRGEEASTLLSAGHQSTQEFQTNLGEDLGFTITEKTTNKPLQD